MPVRRTLAAHDAEARLPEIGAKESPQAGIQEFADVAWSLLPSLQDQISGTSQPGTALCLSQATRPCAFGAVERRYASASNVPSVSGAFEAAATATAVDSSIPARPNSAGPGPWPQAAVVSFRHHSLWRFAFIRGSNFAGAHEPPGTPRVDTGKLQAGDRCSATFL